MSISWNQLLFQIELKLLRHFDSDKMKMFKKMKTPESIRRETYVVGHDSRINISVEAGSVTVVIIPSIEGEPQVGPASR